MKRETEIFRVVIKVNCASDYQGKRAMMLYVDMLYSEKCSNI